MADPRTFTLIGEFKDGITPELQKINNQLASLKTSFSNLGGKGARNASRDMGRFSAAVSSLTDNLKANNQELRASIAPLREYRKEIGKTVGAYKQLNQAGGNVKGLEATNKALREQMRLMEMVQRRSQNLSRTQGAVGPRLNQQARRAQAAMAMGGGGYAAPPSPPRGGRGGGGGGMGAHMAEFGFAFTLGNAIAQPVQAAIVQGFQIGVDLMVKPFQYFANAFGERIQDEISDLKAAGGFLSISKRSQNPFVKNIDEAIQFQQETNETFAKMAAALPGVTNDYVQVGKRLGDTAARIVNQDFKGALEEANRIRQTEEGRKFYGGQITATGPEAQREVITTLLGELTKKTTIAGLGGRSGAGGIAGAYGLPGLTERMLSQQEVSVAQFQRYAAVFSDPTIADALQRNIEKINATQMNSVDRFKAIQKLLDEVVTPELIEKLRTSVDGVYQGLKSVIFDPDTGLFGLGRNFKAFGKRMNQYGQYVNKAGQVVKDIADAADEDLSIFEIVRDIFSNFGQALLPMVESLQLIFDPLKSVANVLMDARHYAGQFNKVFNQYREGLLELSKTKSDAFKNTVDVRASLSAINAFLKNFGVISEKDFKGFGMELMSETLDVGKMMSTMIDKVLNSKIAEDIGELIGEVIGTVLTEVAKVTGFISGRVAGTNKLFEGIKAGFEKAGGVEALKNIFSDVFKTLFKILGEVMKLIPFEGYMLIAAMVVLPAAVQGLGMKIAEGVLAFITRLGDDIPKMLNKGPRGFKGLLPFGKGKTAYTSPIGPLPTPRLTPSERLAGKTRTAGPEFMESGLKKPPAFKDFLKAAVGADESLLGRKAVDLGKGTIGALKAPLASLAGALGALSPLAGKLKGLLSVIDEFTWGVKDALSFFMSWARGDISLTKGIKGLATGGAKGVGVRIVGVAKNVATAAKGGVGGLLGGAKGAAGGLKGLFGKGLQGLGKFGTVATVGVGIVEALMALFSGASLGEALGKGAGPVLGTIIGTALLGPIGGIIGGMIGSMESITEPLGQMFDSVIKTLGVTFEFLGQIGSDILGLLNGFFKSVFGLGESFDFLRAAVFALTLPFRMLELGIRGLYILYLEAKKNFGLASAQEKEKLALEKKVLAARTEQLKLDALEAAGFGKPDDKKTTTKPTTSTTSAKPKVGYLTKNGVQGWLGTDGSWTPLATPKVKTPSKPIGDGVGGLSKPVGGKPTVAKEVTQTAQNTNNINKKATDQIKATTNVKAGVDKTTQAVNNLAVKITPQTKLQTTTAAIYNLLASGQLRVQGSTTPGSFTGPYNPYTNPLGNLPFDTRQTNPNKPSSIFNWAEGGLGDAIRSEVKNKPSGSDLVIANSSETVIPAAGGYGMVEFVDTLKWGFATMIGAFKQAQQKQDTLLNGINQTLKTNQQQTNSRLLAMEKKFTTPGMAGGLGGAAAGGVDAFTPIAQKYGLQMTSGYRPGDPGWHGANRARDFSNGTGPTPQMMQFAQYMASTYGSNLKELIYTPLGFSIKNGQKVPPYAQGSHYNHVHVAYALGLGQGVAFNSLKGAQEWENSMVPGSVRVASVTGNSAEGFGGGTNISGGINVTVHAGNVSDPDELASIVAMKISEAVSDARAASIFV